MYYVMFKNLTAMLNISSVENFRYRTFRFEIYIIEYPSHFKLFVLNIKCERWYGLYFLQMLLLTIFLRRAVCKIYLVFCIHILSVINLHWTKMFSTISGEDFLYHCWSINVSKPSIIRPLDFIIRYCTSYIQKKKKRKKKRTDMYNFIYLTSQANIACLMCLSRHWFNAKRCMKGIWYSWFCKHEL